MALSLKDVLDMRNGIIDFSNKLFSDGGNLKFKNTDGINNMLKSVSFSANVNEAVKEKSEKKTVKTKGRNPIADAHKKAYINDFKKEMYKNQEEISKHMIALDVYALLVEKYNELKAANKGKENDPVITEFGKNVDIFKSQMLKNDIYNFEIDDKLKNDPNIEARIRGGLARNFNDVNMELAEKHHITGRNTNPDKFKEDFVNFVSTENLDGFDAKEIDDKTSKFYGFIKNAGFSFARRLDTDYYEMSNRLDECPSGYKFNEAGEMVEKESKGFFSAISNFFGRLFNSGKVKTYNEALKQSKEALHDEDVLKDVEKMKKLDSEKQLVNLDKEFDHENEMTKDYLKELAAERKLMQEQEMQKSTEEITGPGLDQLD